MESVHTSSGTEGQNDSMIATASHALNLLATGETIHLKAPHRFI